MGKTIRLGVMGCGRMAGWFCTALPVVKDLEMYAAGSRTLEKGQAFAKEYGFKKAYGSYEELLADPDVDLVYVATTISEHYKNVKMCLEAGKPVLCEKAFTINAVQAEELVTLAREKGIFLMEAMWTRCQPVYLKIQEWVKSGLLGDIRAVDGKFYTKTGKGHRLYNKSTGGGALVDLGFYPITYACCFLGFEPESIQSHTIIGDKGTDYFDSVVLTYKDGSFAHLSTGLGEDKRADMYIMGTKGRVSIQDELFFSASKAVAYDFDNNVLDSFEQPHLVNGYEYEAMEAVRCLQEGLTESPLVPLDETVAVLKILDKCRKNAGYRFDFE